MGRRIGGLSVLLALILALGCGRRQQPVRTASAVDPSLFSEKDRQEAEKQGYASLEQSDLAQIFQGTSSGEPQGQWYLPPAPPPNPPPPLACRAVTAKRTPAGFVAAPVFREREEVGIIVLATRPLVGIQVAPRILPQFLVATIPPVPLILTPVYGEKLVVNHYTGPLPIDVLVHPPGNLAQGVVCTTTPVVTAGLACDLKLTTSASTPYFVEQTLYAKNLETVNRSEITGPDFKIEVVPKNAVGQVTADITGNGVTNKNGLTADWPVRSSGAQRIEALVKDSGDKIGNVCSNTVTTLKRLELVFFDPLPTFVWWCTNRIVLTFKNKGSAPVAFRIEGQGATSTATSNSVTCLGPKSFSREVRVEPGKNVSIESFGMENDRKFRVMVTEKEGDLSYIKLSYQISVYTSSYSGSFNF